MQGGRYSHQVVVFLLHCETSDPWGKAEAAKVGLRKAEGATGRHGGFGVGSEIVLCQIGRRWMLDLPFSLPELVDFKLFGKTILVVNIKFELFLGHPLSQCVFGMNWTKRKAAVSIKGTSARLPRRWDCERDEL